MLSQTITRAQVLELVEQMPQDKLMKWYEYGLLIMSQPILNLDETDEAALSQEFVAYCK